MSPEIIEILSVICPRRDYAAGDILRYQGGFARDMVLVLEGEVEIRFEHGSETPSITSGRNTILGEIGFLTGASASASVKALTDLRTVQIGHNELECLERENPEIASAFSRYLARLIRSRQTFNEVLLDGIVDDTQRQVAVLQCNSPELLERAQRVRYAVYCGEFGRQSPYADHERKLLADQLDRCGVTFLARDGDLDVGTARINLARDGDLTNLPDLYGMETSPHHPQRTCVITKYAIREKWRGGTTYMRIFGSMGTYLANVDVAEIFIDCVPKLARFYATMGFRQTAEEFMHYENGLSVPMSLDLKSYTERMPFGERLKRNRWR